MGGFATDRAPLKLSPLQQIWRDHLLAGITLIEDDYDDGMFVMLYPRDNPHVSAALKGYRAQLTSAESFASWTIEGVAAVLAGNSHAPWIGAFADRYLAFGKIDRLLTAAV